MKKMLKALALSCALAISALAQEQTRPTEDAALQRIRALEERLSTMEQSLAKDTDDLMWFVRMSDIANVGQSQLHRATSASDSKSDRTRRRQSGRHSSLHLHSEKSSPPPKFRCWFTSTAEFMAISTTLRIT
jgi:hypothetical protein